MPARNTAMKIERKLIILSGPERGKEELLIKDRTELGSSPVADIQLEGYGLGERTAVFELRGSLCVIKAGDAEDIRSKGQGFREKILEPGEVFEAGSLKVRYVTNAPSLLEKKSDYIMLFEDGSKKML